MVRGCGAALTPLHYFHRTLFPCSAAAAEPLVHYHPHLNVSPLCEIVNSAKDAAS